MQNIEKYFWTHPNRIFEIHQEKTILNDWWKNELKNL